MTEETEFNLKYTTPQVKIADKFLKSEAIRSCGFYQTCEINISTFIYCCSTILPEDILFTFYLRPQISHKLNQ